MSVICRLDLPNGEFVDKITNHYNQISIQTPSMFPLQISLELRWLSTVSRRAVTPAVPAQLAWPALATASFGGWEDQSISELL